MERNIRKTGLLNLIVMLIAAGIGTFIARYTNSQSDEIGITFLWLGFLVACFSYFQMGMEAREKLEKLEMDELARSAGKTTLFDVPEVDAFPAQRAREQFEKWLIPAFSILLFILQGGMAYYLWNWILTTPRTEEPQHLVTMAAVFSLFFFCLFLLGKYSAGIARLEKQRLLRPAAAYMQFGAYLFVAMTASVLAVKYRTPKIDDYISRVLCAILTLAAAETLISLIMEVYRPRVKGQPARLIYDSRLVGLLAQPEGLVTTAAQVLDYQFGFKVSETKFYRFFAEWIGVLILIQLAALAISTCFVFIEPGEKALLERFGEPVAGREVLLPGANLKFPWPIDQVYRYPTERIQTFSVGFVPDPSRSNETTVVWTTAHTKEEFNMLVASAERDASGITNGPSESVPVNLLTVSIPVQYKIKDVVSWARQNADPEGLLEKIANREVVLYLVGVDLFDIMSNGKEKAANELLRRIQSRADELKLGAEIVFVGVKDIHPPIGNENTQVAGSFENVIGAQQEREAKILTAEGVAAGTTAMAAAERSKILYEAESFRWRRTASADAQAARFANQITAFNSAPSVYPMRLYLQSLAAGTTGTNAPRKYIVATTNSHEVFQMNLEDKIRGDLMIDRIAVPTKPK